MGGTENPDSKQHADDDAALLTPPTVTPATTPAGGSQATRPEIAPTLVYSSSAQLSVQIQDLLGDVLLKSAPRTVFDGRSVPCLGGIPLLAKLGQGGMGAVYYGIKPLLRQEIAVKVLPEHLAQEQPQMVERFLREAQIASRIESPHLVRVVDVNQESGVYYLVMEFVSGVSAGGLLKKMLKDGHKGLDEATALEICIGATTGLAAAHARGVIHRDVKPDNILLPKSGESDLLFKAAKLADLGLARSDELTGPSLTGTQSSMGTPGFMSPEQCVNTRKARKPADVFSMGAALYALLCGRPPFKGESHTETVLATIQQPHVPVTQLRPDITPLTAALLDRCLAKKPDERYVDGSALLKALALCRQHVEEPAATQLQAIESLHALQKSPEVGQKLPSSVGESGGTPPYISTAAPSAPAASPVSDASKSNPAFVLGLAALLLVAAAAGLWKIMPQGDGQASKTPVAATAAAKVELNIALGSDNEKWFKWAAGKFNETPAGRNVSIQFESLSAEKVQDDLLAGEAVTDLWCPANDLYHSIFEDAWKAKYSTEPVLRRESLALSPMVFVMFEDRLRAFEKKYQNLSFATLNTALQEKANWETIAVNPDWGRLTFALTDPSHFNSGMASLALMAYEFNKSDLELTPAEVQSSEFRSWVLNFQPLISKNEDVSHAMKDMVLRGPSAFDGAFLYESTVIQNLKFAENRWGNLRVVYPRINYWNEHPCYVINRPSLTQSEKDAANAFVDFLLTEPAQKELLPQGFRPANASVGILFPESPFSQYKECGLRVDVPIAGPAPSPKVIKVLLEGARSGWK